MTEVAASGSPTSTPPNQAEHGHAEKAVVAAAWFYWIAGITCLNVVLQWIGVERAFSIGLGAVLFLGGVARGIRAEAGDGAGIVADVVTVVVALALAAGFAGLGVMARKPRVWPFAVGTILYGADTLLFLLGGVSLGLFIHLFILANIANGWRLARKSRPALQVEPQSAQP